MGKKKSTNKSTPPAPKHLSTDGLVELSSRLFDPILKPPRIVTIPKPPALAMSKLPPPAAEIDGRPAWRTRRFRLWRDNAPSLLLAVLDPRRRNHLRRYQAFVIPTETKFFRGQIVTPWLPDRPKSGPLKPRPLVLLNTPFTYNPTAKVPKAERKARYQRLLQYRHALDQEHERRFRRGMSLCMQNVIDFERKYVKDYCEGDTGQPWMPMVGLGDAMQLTQFFKDIRNKSANIFHFVIGTNIRPVPRLDEVAKAVKAEDKRKEKRQAEKERKQQEVVQAQEAENVDVKNEIARISERLKKNQEEIARLKRLQAEAGRHEEQEMLNTLIKDDRTRGVVARKGKEREDDAAAVVNTVEIEEERAKEAERERKRKAKKERQNQERRNRRKAKEKEAKAQQSASSVEQVSEPALTDSSTISARSVPTPTTSSSSTHASRPRPHLSKSEQRTRTNDDHIKKPGTKPRVSVPAGKADDRDLSQKRIKFRKDDHSPNATHEMHDQVAKGLAQLIASMQGGHQDVQSPSSQAVHRSDAEPPKSPNRSSNRMVTLPVREDGKQPAILYIRPDGSSDNPFINLLPQLFNTRNDDNSNNDREKEHNKSDSGPSSKTGKVGDNKPKIGHIKRSEGSESPQPKYSSSTASTKTEQPLVQQPKVPSRDSHRRRPSSKQSQATRPSRERSKPTSDTVLERKAADLPDRVSVTRLPSPITTPKKSSPDTSHIQSPFSSSQHPGPSGSPGAEQLHHKLQELGDKLKEYKRDKRSSPKPTPTTTDDQSDTHSHSVPTAISYRYGSLNMDADTAAPFREPTITEPGSILGSERSSRMGSASGSESGDSYASNGYSEAMFGYDMNERALQGTRDEGATERDTEITARPFSRPLMISR